MKHWTPLLRISLGLVFLTISIILVGDGFVSIGTHDTEALYDQRKKLCEFLAVQYSTLVQKGEFETIRKSLKALVIRNPDVVSTALRKGDDQLLATIFAFGRSRLAIDRRSPMPKCPFSMARLVEED